MIDKLGKEINIGDYIAYAAGYGDSCILKFGKVLKLKTELVDRWHSTEKVEEHSLTVIGLDQYSRAPSLNERTGTISRIERVVVLPEGFLPETHKNLLDSYIFPAKGKEK